MLAGQTRLMPPETEAAVLIPFAMILLVPGMSPERGPGKLILITWFAMVLLRCNELYNTTRQPSMGSLGNATRTPRASFVPPEPEPKFVPSP